MKQKTSKVQTITKCQIVAGNQRYTINDSVIRANKNLNCFTDGNDLDNYLLQNSRINVELAVNDYNFENQI